MALSYSHDESDKLEGDLLEDNCQENLTLVYSKRKREKNQLATGNKQVQIIDILKNQVLIIQNFTQDSLPHNTNRVLSTTRLLEIQIVAAKFESP